MPLMPWLPEPPENFREQLRQLAKSDISDIDLNELRVLANFNLDAIDTQSLAKIALRVIANVSVDCSQASGFDIVRVAISSECTVDHIVPSLVAGGLRRKMLIQATIGGYGALQQDLYNKDSAIRQAHPQFVLFVFEPERRFSSFELPSSRQQVQQQAKASMLEARELAQRTKETLSAVSIFSTVVPLHTPLFGEHEEIIGLGPQSCASQFNRQLLDGARDNGYLVWNLEALAAEIGYSQFVDKRFWYHAKMPVSPEAAVLAGDRLSSLIGAALGKSKKVLVLDLDNTLWGGVIGDDGIAGVKLGQGSSDGEAHVAFQRYVLSLKQRGIILAVSSKNTHSVAELAIRNHPEMVLRIEDFAIFLANWKNKADNITEIATNLNLGLDAFVFFDDSQVERELIRLELPAVAVPEAGNDPSEYVSRLAGARYFENVALTSEDRDRARQYRENSKRSEALETSRDLSSFLNSLQTKIAIRRFCGEDLARITQLVNKTNQFNLTTRRYTESEIGAFMNNPRCIALSVKSADRFGDNGLVSVVIAVPNQTNDLVIDTWLMSCRVLSRGIEDAVMRSLVRLATERGHQRLIGHYVPTGRNGMVKDFYSLHGFREMEPAIGSEANGKVGWLIDIDNYQPKELFAEVECST